MSSLSKLRSITPCHLILSRSILSLPVSQPAARWLLHDFLNSLLCFNKEGVSVDFRLPAYSVVSPPLIFTIPSDSQPSKVEEEELLMVGDGVKKMIMMSTLVTSSRWSRQQNKRGLNSLLPWQLRERKNAQRLMYPFGFLFNSASIRIFKFPSVSFCKEENILICSADFISLLLPGMKALRQFMQDIRWFGSLLSIFDAI